MEQPVFPEEFFKHCPKVLEAKGWYQRLTPNEEFVAKDHAECAFNNAGLGLECENCRKFIMKPVRCPADEFVDEIKQFYKDWDEWEKQQDIQQKENAPEFAKFKLDLETIRSSIVALRWLTNTEEIRQQVSSKGLKSAVDFLSKLEEAHYEMTGESL